MLAPRGTAAEAPAAVAPPLTTTMTAINRRDQPPLELAKALLPSTEDSLGSRPLFDLPGLRRRRSCLLCPTARPCPRCCPTWQVGLFLWFEGFDGSPRATGCRLVLHLALPSRSQEGDSALCHGLSAHTRATCLCCASQRTGGEFTTESVVVPKLNVERTQKKMLLGFEFRRNGMDVSGGCPPVGRKMFSQVCSLYPDLRFLCISLQERFMRGKTYVAFRVASQLIPTHNVCIYRHNRAVVGPGQPPRLHTTATTEIAQLLHCSSGLHISSRLMISSHPPFYSRAQS